MDGSTQHILIAGGSGFLGQSLKTYFENAGRTVRVLSRNATAPGEIIWDGCTIGEWISQIEWADVLINLAGKSVNCRYTEKNKNLILSSRLDSTNILCEAIMKAKNPPHLWINSSSATTYVHSETQLMTEDEGIIGDDFSMGVCKQWEAAFFGCQLEHTRKVAMRTSIVLGKKGGALPMLRKIARLGLGGKQGNGRQFFSWIHILDFCRATEFIMNSPALVGPVNVTSPKPMRNTDVMQQIRKSVGMPFGLTQPKWLLELGGKIIGTETELLLKSRNVYPERLLDFGFQFSHTDLAGALTHTDT